MPLIQPRTLKGFRDYPPALMIPREQLLEKARQVYRSYGFAPIDTPALEYTEILLGKVVRSRINSFIVSWIMAGATLLCASI